MEEKSKFQFKGFKVNKSLIEVNNSDYRSLDIDIELSGVIKLSEGLFLLSMKSLVFNDDKSINIEVSTTAEYIFPKEQDLEKLKSFMFLNAPAILFPYVRAYISTLTNLSGIPPVNLPTINFVNKIEMLKENTITI